MSITIPKYQALYFKSLEAKTINTGPNLVQNGNFQTDLSSWGPINFAWSAGTASYQHSEGCFIGQIEQEVSLVAKTRYKLELKYKATKAFGIHVKVNDLDTYDEIMPEHIEVANIDGNWHIITLWVNNLTNIDAILQIYCFSLIDGEEDSCAEEGNAENGFFLDDVSIYAQKAASGCGDCDTVGIDKSKPLEFQISGRKITGSNLYPNSEFNTNPFSPITTTTFVFDIASIPTINQYFVLYVNDKVFIINYGGYNAGTPLSYAILNYNIFGNVHYFQINQYRPSGITLSDVQDAVLTAFVVNIDGLIGSSSNRVGATITITGLPAGSFLDNSFGWLTSISSIGAAAFSPYLRNGYYNKVDNKMCYFNAGLTLGKFQYKNNISFLANKYYKIRVEWTSSYSDWQNVKFIINDGTNPATEIPFSIISSSTGRFLDFEYKALITSTHSVELTITDTAIPHNYELCFDNITIYEIKLDDITVEVKDCNGNITTPAFTQIPYKSNVLIQINNNDLPQSGTFQIILTESITTLMGLQYFSQFLKLIDIHASKECDLRRLIKITWWADFFFRDIDYGNLPYKNELFLYGYVKKAPLDKKERILFGQPDGSYKQIYNHSVGKSELQLSAYSKTLMQVLERAFEHIYFTLDDAFYNNDDGSVLITKSLDNGKYTARIELIESGTEVITTNSYCK